MLLLLRHHHPKPSNVDGATSLLIHEISLSIPLSVLKTLEISSDRCFFFPVIISLLPFSYSNDNNCYFSIFLILLGLILDILLIGALKFFIRRPCPRPVYNKGMILIVSVDHRSFPSGHSSRVFFVASFLYLAASHGEFLVSNAIVGGVFLWAAATSISRVMLRWYFIGDVIAGAILGVVEGVFIRWFFKGLFLLQLSIPSQKKISTFQVNLQSHSGKRLATRFVILEAMLLHLTHLYFDNNFEERLLEEENKRLTYILVDTYGLCVNVHMMLHRQYMSIEKKAAPYGNYLYQPKSPLKRRKKNRWKGVHDQKHRRAPT